MSHEPTRLEDLVVDPPRTALPLGDRLRRPGPGRDARRGRRPRPPGAGRRPGERRAPGRRRVAPTRSPQGAAAQGPGEAGHPPVHERRPVAGRHLRPQADARRSTTARPLPTRPPAPSARPARRSGSPFKFQQVRPERPRGQRDLRATVGECVDDICVIRSMHADVPNHEPSLMLMNCGEARQPRPEPRLVGPLRPGDREPEPPRLHRHVPRRLPDRRVPELAVGLPARHLPGDVHRQQAHRHREADRPHPQPRRRRRAPAGPARPAGRAQPGAPRRSGSTRPTSRPASSRSSWPTGCSPRPPTPSTSAESRAYIRALYGPGVHARQLLIARRLLERGVRFVQVWHGAGQPWDNHDDIEAGHRSLAGQCDQADRRVPVQDLKQRGMLDDTLVVWGGEFGRTPTVELPTPGANAGKMNGRDHNHYGFTMWMAGGGVKGGHVHGATDEFGFQAVENPVHVHDLHATILHLLGFDHETAHLPLRRPRLPPDRRPRQRRPRRRGVAW